MSDSGSSSESDSDFDGGRDRRPVPDLNGTKTDQVDFSSEDQISFFCSSDDEFLPAMMKKKKPSTVAKKSHESVRSKLSAHKVNSQPSGKGSTVLEAPLKGGLKSEGVSTSHDVTPEVSMHNRHPQPPGGSVDGKGEGVTSPTSPHTSHRVFENKRKEDLLSLEKKRRRLSSMNRSQKPVGKSSSNAEISHIKEEDPLSSSSSYPPPHATQPDMSWQRKVHMMKHRGKISAMAGYNKSSSVSPSPKVGGGKGRSALHRTDSGQSTQSLRDSDSLGLDRPVQPSPPRVAPHRGKFMPRHKKQLVNGSLASASSESESEAEEVSRKPPKPKVSRSKAESLKATRHTNAVPPPPKKRGRPPKNKKQEKPAKPEVKVPKPAKKRVVESSDSDRNSHVSDVEEDTRPVEASKATRKLSSPTPKTATSVLTSSSKVMSDDKSHSKSLEPDAKPAFQGSIWGDSGYLKSSSSEKSDSSSSGSDSDETSPRKVEKVAKTTPTPKARDRSNSSDEEMDTGVRGSVVSKEVSPAAPSQHSKYKTSDRKSSDAKNQRASSKSKKHESPPTAQLAVPEFKVHKSRSPSPLLQSTHKDSQHSKKKKKQSSHHSTKEARSRSPSPPSRKVTPFTAAKLPGTSSRSPEEGREKSGAGGKKAEGKKVKAPSNKRKRNVFSSDSDSDSDSDDERFANFLKATATKPKPSTNAASKPSNVDNQVKDNKGAKKDQAKNEKEKSKKSSSATSGGNPAKANSSSTKGQSGPSTTSTASRKRPLEKEEDDPSNDKKLRLVDIDFTGGKLKKAQQQQQNSQKATSRPSSSKLSRLQKLRMQSQKMLHGSSGLQRTPHTFTSKATAPSNGRPPVASTKSVQDTTHISPVKSISNNHHKSYSPAKSSVPPRDDNASPVKNLSQHGSNAKPHSVSPMKSSTHSNTKMHSTPAKHPPSKDRSKSPARSSGSHGHDRDSTQSPLRASGRHESDISWGKSSSHHSSKSKGSSPVRGSASYNENHSAERLDSASPSLQVVSSSVTATGVTGTTKIIQGDRKYYSPIRSMGKMMPLLTESPVKEHKKHHHHHHHKHHATETSESHAPRGVDVSQAGGDPFAHKDAILAAKFPQKRNRIVPSLGSSAAAKDSGGSGSKHHRSEHSSGHSHSSHSSHSRVNRTAN